MNIIDELRFLTVGFFLETFPLEPCFYSFILPMDNRIRNHTINFEYLEDSMASMSVTHRCHRGKSTNISTNYISTSRRHYSMLGSV
jgi:hypothetical protein